MNADRRPDQPSRSSGRAAERDRWLGLDLRHLAALSAVAQERSFSAAAERLGYVQSAVSQQISYLERMVGTRLVQRGKGPQPVSLTPSGEALLAHVDAILLQLREAQLDVERLVHGEIRVLRIGVDRGMAFWLMPLVLRRLRATSQIDTIVRETTSDGDLFDLVESAELDAALADMPLVEGPFAAEPILDDPYRLVVAAGSPLATRGVIHLDELRELPVLAVHANGAGSLEAVLHEHDICPNFVFRSNVAHTLQKIVTDGVGAAILPSLTIDVDRADIVTVALPELPPRSIALFWHEQLAAVGALEGLKASARSAAQLLEKRRSKRFATSA